ncbi:MAG: helix-turn-helix transcriptional regulator [Bacteroidales bacterium]|nr:helix-turn-helix transcriptional regulator [Bacteroidales bacterium]
MQNTEIKDRVLQLINREKLSSSKFAEIIGVQRSSISHIISGRNKPSLDFIEKVLDKFSSLNPNWLVTGNGGMYLEVSQNKIDFSNEITESDLIEQTENSKKNNLQNTTINSELNLQENTIQKKIEKIIVFYNDNTFETLNPEN